MISDTERLIDGFRGLPAGMDGSKEPPQTPSEAAWYATNVTFRGGNGPRTRSGFREIPPTYWRNPQPRKSVTSISISGGVATVTVTGHNYDQGDLVTIAGATPSGVNGTFKITVTGANTFTYPTTATGSVTGTITAIRDVDFSYSEDYVGGQTSRTRYLLDIVGGKYVQGAFVYQDPRLENPTQIVLVVDGKILSLNFSEASVQRLNIDDEISDDVPVFMTQAEKYLIIQTGKDEPRVYDGYTVRRASYYGNQSIPIGKQMAYGQGRLFVAVNDGSEIVAGDLVFGGSTTNVGITSSSAANPSLVTTTANHGFNAGDQVTISGHSSTPPINSTYTIASTPAPNTFTIPVAVTSAGTKGFVSRFNAGQDSDLLRFTENTFLNEGGSLSPTGKVGNITGLAFLPVQDTSTGQGDLIAFCERGAVTFQVSAPRDQWKNIPGFQRVLFDNIGSTSDNIIPINGDLFFRSKEGNGIRTYRNARAEAASYGQTPISAEIDPVLKQDTQWMLDQVSFAYFDNRLLMTCLPQKFPRRATGLNYAAIETQAAQYAAEPVPTLFNGIAVLDFQSVSAGRGKSAAVFDGVWTGIRIAKLLQGTFGNEPRCFAICLHEDETGRKVELWEITKNDEYDTPIEGKRRIKSGIVTRAFDFRDPMGLKKLIRCDLWFDDLGGGLDYPFECELAYRPDDYPNFTTWQSFSRAFETEQLVGNAAIFSDYDIDLGGWTFAGVAAYGSGSLANNATSPDGFLNADTLSTLGGQAAFVTKEFTSKPGVNYSFSVYLKYDNHEWVRLALVLGQENKSAWFNTLGGFVGTSDSGVSANITPVGNGWYKATITSLAVTSGVASTIIEFALDDGVSVGQVASSKRLIIYGPYLERGFPDTDDIDVLLNVERGYAPQIRFPAPPRTANITTDVPAYLGHDFTLRVNWTGRGHLGRLMLHSHRLVENVGGGSL